MSRPFDAKAASDYGQLVQAAYTMYFAAPTNVTPPPSADFPAGYTMVAWIQMQDFILESTSPLFYGFVAQSTVDASQFVITIRGTSNGVEWWDDVDAIEKTPFKIANCGMVGRGFARIYDTLEVVECPTGLPRTAAAVPQSLRPAGGFSAQVSALIRRHAPAQAPARARAGRGAAKAGPLPASASIDVAGHSLGAALATLYVMENAQTEKIINPLLCTFASPLVGDATFASAFNALGLTSWRVDNAPDLVTKVPPEILGFAHVDTLVPVNSAGKVLPLVNCWHSLATYLSLIDETKQPDAGCRLLVAAAPLSRAAALLRAEEVASTSVEGAGPQVVDRVGAAAAPQINKPFVIDIDHGDDVQDTPGPLGGFERVKASGIAFLIHKATEGLTFVDHRYDARRAAWMNGIPVPVTDINGEPLQLVPRFAAYHFFHGEDPEAEAKFFLETARLQPGDDAVIDWEAVPGSGFVPSADAVDRFCNVVEQKLGFPIIVYSGNAAKEQLHGNDPRFAKRRLWLAQYSSTWSVQPSWSYPWLWQNNGGQRGGLNSIPGIDGNCDNSTIALPSPMTIKQLAATWGGGVQAVAAQAAAREAVPGVSVAAAPQITKPFVIDINHGDNVEDTPGPLGGFEQVKASGIAFLIHKATEGLTFADPRYDARRAAWMNGIPVAVTDINGESLQLVPRFAAYHFFHGEDPEAEAKFFLETARLQPGDDAVIDWEAVPGSGFVPTADAVDRFCNVVEQTLGFPIIVYSGNAAKEQLHGNDPRFAKRRLWLAQYSSTWSVQPSWSYPWLWQNNGGQRGGLNSIPGIDGNCDNSTIALPSQMTVKQLAATWGGGAQAVAAQAAAREAVRRVSVVRGPQRIKRPVARKIARYGWKPDLPDQRDYSYAVSADVMQNISGSVDLRAQCPQVYDQGHIGSCTANAIAAALEFDMMKQGLPSFTPSRLFIYYNERSMEGTVGSDSGAYIRDGIKSVASQGDCPESEWTYDGTAALPGGVFPTGAKATVEPSPQCYTDAIRHTAMNYQSIDQNLADMKGCLASGYPFVFGFTVYPSFESDDVAHTGVVPMPGNEQTIGGHAVLAVGYDDNKNMFIIRNSWGAVWGIGGYCYMPYAYLLDNNLADDFWTIRLVD